MDIEEEVKELIDCHGEGDYLDFKEYDYHKENKEELVKDIMHLLIHIVIEINTL